MVHSLVLIKKECISGLGNIHWFIYCFSSKKSVYLDWEIFICVFVLIKKHIPGYSVIEIDILGVFLAVETYQSYRQTDCYRFPAKVHMIWLGKRPRLFIWPARQGFLSGRLEEVIYLGLDLTDQEGDTIHVCPSDVAIVQLLLKRPVYL